MCAILNDNVSGKKLTKMFVVCHIRSENLGLWMWQRYCDGDGSSTWELRSVALLHM